MRISDWSSDVCSSDLNGYNEGFNGSLRDELLNGEIFYSLAEARVLIEAWRRHYNTVRPHSSLGYRPPAPEAATPPLPASGSALLHLRPAMAAETTMHKLSTRTTRWGLRKIGRAHVCTQVTHAQLGRSLLLEKNKTT